MDRWAVEEAQATFRGIPFWVLKRSRAGGRRGPVHEMPMRDEPDGEDLGRRVRSFSVTAMVLGLGDDDAVRDRDAETRALQLIAALEVKSGPGIYRDPWHGSWKVICRKFSAVSDINRSGVVAFDIAFEESGDTRYPTAGTDTPTMVQSAASTLSASGVAHFGKTFSLSGQPSWVTALAQTSLTAVTSALSGLRLIQLDVLSALGITDAAAALASLTAVIAGLGVSSDSAAVGAAMAATFRAVGGSSYSSRSGSGSASAARTAFASLGSFSLTAITNATIPSRVAAASNQTAIAALASQLAVAEEARALSSVTWDSVDQALSQQASILATISAVQIAALDSGAADVAAAAAALASAVVADVSARAPATQRRTTTLSVALPACVVAYKLTGAATQEADLLARNGISHPLFTPAAQTLEYLSG